MRLSLGRWINHAAGEHPLDDVTTHSVRNTNGEAPILAIAQALRTLTYL